MFVAEFEPAENHGHRRSPRAPISVDAHLGLGGLGRTLCRVTDISIHGARLQTYSGLKRGTTIWLTLPVIGLCAADVKWAGDFEAGCQFRTPLDPVAFEALLRIDTGVTIAKH